MSYHCRRCIPPQKYSTDIKHHFISHLGRIDDNHNMGPWVCQVPGCHVRGVRRGSIDPHEGHPGINSAWDRDANLVAAIAAEIAASERPAPVAPPAPSAAGPAGSTTAESATLTYGSSTSPYPPRGFYRWTRESDGLPPDPYSTDPTSPVTPDPDQSTTVPTIAADSSNTTSSSTPTTSFPIHPDLVAMNHALVNLNPANHATPNNHNHGVNHGASTQNHHNNNNNGEGPSSASAPLEHSTPTILAHGEDESTKSDSDDSESSREYLIRTGVAPLFMEAMKLLALTDPPVEKPLLWAGKWFEARSREIEGVDEEDEKEDVKDGGKEKEKEDKSEEKENEDEDEKEDEKEPEKNDEKDGEKNVEKNVEKDDQKDVEVGGEKEAKKQDEHK
ncbi:hypothetical protein KCU65_g7656, partial [Aureobasidium melanogenum]